MIIDPIGDLLTRLRNAYLARILEVKSPYSKLKSDLLKILKKNKVSSYIINSSRISKSRSNKVSSFNICYTIVPTSLKCIAILAAIQHLFLFYMIYTWVR